MIRYLLELSSRNPVFAIEPVIGFQMANMVSLMLSRDIPLSGEPFGLEKSRAFDYRFTGGSGSGKTEKRIRVIEMHGIMTMHGGDCSYGMVDYGRMIKIADADPKVDGIVLDMNTPGGEAMYTETLAQIVKNTSKPIIGFANNLTASAGYYIISATDKIVLSGRSAQLGSIGTLIHYLDFTRKLKAEGIDEIMILATKSKKKRKYNFSQPTEEDRTKIIDGIIDPSNEVFISDVKRYRPQAKEEVFEADVYRGQAAIDMGLADQFGTLEDAIILAAELSDPEFNNQNNHSGNMNNKQKETQGLISGLKSFIARFEGDNKKVEQIEDSPEEKQEGGEGQGIDKDALIAQLQGENQKLIAQLKEQDETIEKQNTDFKDLTAEVKRLGAIVPEKKLPGQSAEEGTPGKEEQGGYVFPETEAAIKEWETNGY